MLMSKTWPGATSIPISASLNTFAISAGVYIVLNGTANAPIRDTASHQMIHSAPLAKNSPTRLPLPTPSWSNQRATCAERRSASSYVSRSVGVATYVFWPKARALWARSAGMVSGRGWVTPGPIQRWCQSRLPRLP